MELTISHLLSILGIIFGLGSGLFTAGMYFGVLKTKLRDCDEVREDFYKHVNDERKHLAERDWQNFADKFDTLQRGFAKMEHAIEELKMLIMNRK